MFLILTEFGKFAQLEFQENSNGNLPGMLSDVNPEQAVSAKPIFAHCYNRHKLNIKSHYTMNKELPISFI